MLLNRVEEDQGDIVASQVTDASANWYVLVVRKEI